MITASDGSVSQLRYISALPFDGWTIEALDFYGGLEADNSKTYWTAHKGVYESEIRDPLAEGLAEFEPEFGPGRTYRPLRDTRFSADKTPRGMPRDHPPRRPAPQEGPVHHAGVADRAVAAHRRRAGADRRVPAERSAAA